MSTTAPQPTVTLRTIRQWVGEGQRFAMLTCYDATTARCLWQGGVKCLLVGDTAAQMILGHDTTLPVSMDFMVEITAAVKRGAPKAFVMADMPFGSYQCGDDEAVRNAIRFLKEGDADAVKLEVGLEQASLIARLTGAGVPVVAHIGSRPQHVRTKGGYGPVGKTTDEADALVHTAQTMVDHGAVMILIEAVPAQVSRRVVDTMKVNPAGKLAGQSSEQRPGQGHPVAVIGCGAGPACHGQVVVLHDLLGLSRWQPPFAKPLIDLGSMISSVAGQWAQQVCDPPPPDQEHPYKMRP